MTKLHQQLSFLIFLFFVTLISCLAQDEGNTPAKPVDYKIIAKDGNQYIGQIIRQNSDSIVFKTNNIGTITIATSHVKSITEIINNETGVNGWPYQFQAANYLTLNSAYGLKKGEGYYQNIWILFNNASYGITDNFSIGIGALGTFLFTEFAPVWATARLSIPVVENKFNAGGGAIVGTAEGQTFGFLYGVATLGPRDRNISVGLGSGFVEGEFSDIYLNIDGTFRVSEKFYLIMENYLIESDVLTFIGGRSILGRSSLEYGIMRTPDLDFIGIPILGVTVPLHKH